MTIILFLIDTSASMCQKAYVNGVQKSYLDIAKGAVETFLKYRQRSQDCLGDRYMLLTFEDPPCNVKAGWKENHATFMNELKNLQSNGLTSMGEALKNAFDLLNLNRMQSGIDTYGQGRCPFYLEPSVIIVITDGGKYSFRNGVHQEIILPLNAQIPGTKFTKEPFRWDQRLFSLVLRMPGNKVDERVDGKVPHDDSPIERMCEVTGGRSYRVKSQYVLNQCIESLVQKVQPGVVLHFEPLISKELKDGEIQDIAIQTTKKMIYVQKHPAQKSFPAGNWPLPEPYWPDPKVTTLPPRDAHPKIRIITPCVDEPQVVRSFPVDKYEIEASPLTLQILSKRESNKCWPVMIANGLHGFEAPFGYLKANPTFTQVYLFVLPYNYPILLPLLHDLIHKFVMNPPADWVYKFTSYVRSIPQYYCPFLRRALMIINFPYQLLTYILPESVDNYLNPNVANYLKQIKNTAKQDQENLCLKVYKQLKQPKPPYRQIETAKLNCSQPLRRDLVRNPMLKETFSKLHSDISTFENYTIVVPVMTQQISAKNYRNPYDIPRRDIIDEAARMRDQFIRSSSSGVSLISRDAGHCLPIAEMGNYQEYLKNRETPLREIEPTNVRQHMFGNPYKKDKHMVMVDEADLGEVALSKPITNTPKKLESNSRLRKRKAGPIRKDYVFRRLSTDSKISVPSQMSASESEDDMSDTSSTVSDDNDRDRLMIAFDFNEIPDEFSINGHIRSFINGDYDDSSEILVPRSFSPLPQISNNGLLGNNMIRGGQMVMYNLPDMDMNIHQQQQIFRQQQQQQQHQQQHQQHLQQQQSPQSNGHLYNGISLPSMSSNQMQNDISDTQEISRILQQCHNGIPESEIDESLSSAVNDKDEKLKSTTTTITTTSEAAPVAITTTTTATSTATSTPAAPDTEAKIIEELTEEQKENIRKKNLEVRSIVFKDIRRPGRDYSTLLDHLNLIQGDFEIKFNFIQMCINESLRFRRRKMADSIQEWWEKHSISNIITIIK